MARRFRGCGSPHKQLVPKNWEIWEDLRSEIKLGWGKIDLRWPWLWM